MPKKTIGLPVFGNIVSTSGSLLGDRVSFTGREYEDNLGLYYYRARYYDPNIGRFISSDPIGFAAGDVNLYRYVRNCTILLEDPLGLTSIESEISSGMESIKDLERWCRLYIKVHESIDPFLVAGAELGLGSVITASTIAALVALYADGVVPGVIATPFMIPVIVGGELLILHGVNNYMQIFNNLFGTDIPTLSDILPEYFPPWDFDHTVTEPSCGGR